MYYLRATLCQDLLTDKIQPSACLEKEDQRIREMMLKARVEFRWRHVDILKERERQLHRLLKIWPARTLKV